MIVLKKMLFCEDNYIICLLFNKKELTYNNKFHHFNCFYEVNKF